jgi:hypothetical protein
VSQTPFSLPPKLNGVFLLCDLQTETPRPKPRRFPLRGQAGLSLSAEVSEQCLTSLHLAMSGV